VTATNAATISSNVRLQQALACQLLGHVTSARRWPKSPLSACQSGRTTWRKGNSDIQLKTMAATATEPMYDTVVAVAAPSMPHAGTSSNENATVDTNDIAAMEAGT